MQITNSPRSNYRNSEYNKYSPLGPRGSVALVAYLDVSAHNGFDPSEDQKRHGGERRKKNEMRLGGHHGQRRHRGRPPGRNGGLLYMPYATHGAQGIRKP